MAEKRVERRLAAILAADVAGYTRLMGIDEEGTHQSLKAHCRGLVEPKIEQHRGRIIKNTGDGFLAEFTSVVDAVRCATEIQQGMIVRNAEVPDDRRIEFRMGIHQGDIIIDSGDIFGDGVNLAARLEGVADPGGICMSARVQEDVRGTLDLPFEDIGEQHLKNIQRPVRVYRIAPENRSAEAVPILALPDKPSIVVLPFQNMSGDQEQEYFADGIVEDITTALARLPWFFVIGRNSSFAYKGRSVEAKQVGRDLGARYILEGSVRHSGNRVRVTSQLIDATTGVHLWAERFDGELSDVFDLQDQVTSSVVGALAPKLERAEIERATRKPTESLNAYDCYMRGLASFHKGSRSAITQALGFFDRAIELDPKFASAYAMAAWCYIIGNNNGWLTELNREIERMKWLAKQAERFGKEDPLALSVSGVVLAQVLGDLVAGAALLDRAVVLGPSLAVTWQLSGWIRLYLGQPRLAIEHFDRAVRLDPLDPLLYGTQNGLAAAHFLAGQYGLAAVWAERALHEQPNYSAAIRMAAASHALEGQIDKARSYMTRMLKIDPTLRASALKGMVPFRASADIARYVSGLQKAGLPE